MKKVNKVLIASKNEDLAAKIREANYLEEMEAESRTPEGIISEVKTALGLESGQSVIAEFGEKTKSINKLQKNFIDVNSLTERLLNDKLISDYEVELLNGIEAKIGEKLISIYDIDSEDLYLEEDDE